MKTVQTPVGAVSWDGELAPDTVLTVKGRDLPMQQFIAMTNGECLEWLVEHL